MRHVHSPQTWINAVAGEPEHGQLAARKRREAPTCCVPSGRPCCGDDGAALTGERMCDLKAPIA